METCWGPLQPPHSQAHGKWRLCWLAGLTQCMPGCAMRGTASHLHPNLLPPASAAAGGPEAGAGRPGGGCRAAEAIPFSAGKQGTGAIRVANPAAVTAGWRWRVTAGYTRCSGSLLPLCAQQHGAVANWSCSAVLNQPANQRLPPSHAQGSQDWQAWEEAADLYLQLQVRPRFVVWLCLARLGMQGAHGSCCQDGARWLAVLCCLQQAPLQALGR